MECKCKAKYNQSMVKDACTRSMSELSNILLNFFENEYNNLQTKTKNLFIKLLEYSDEKLFQWLIGDTLPTDANLHDLVLCIRYFSCTNDKLFSKV